MRVFLAGATGRRVRTTLFSTTRLGPGRGAAVRALEQAVTETEGIEGAVLRYGFFYGPGSAYAGDGFYAREVRRRLLPLIGDGGGVFSFVHVDDAAQAAFTAVEQGKPGIYNVVDDEPAPAPWVPRSA